MYSTSLGFIQVKIDGVVRYSFNFLKASSHSLVHSKVLLVLSKLKKGASLSVDLDMNWVRAANLSFSACTSLMFVMLFMSIIA